MTSFNEITIIVTFALLLLGVTIVFIVGASFFVASRSRTEVRTSLLSNKITGGRLLLVASSLSLVIIVFSTFNLLPFSEPITNPFAGYDPSTPQPSDPPSPQPIDPGPPGPPGPPDPRPSSTVELKSLTMEQPIATFARPAQARVTLSGPAPFPGAVIELRSSDVTLARVPDFTLIPSGQTSSTFSVSAQLQKPSPDAVNLPVVISAQYMGRRISTTVRVTSTTVGVTR